MFASIGRVQARCWILGGLVWLLSMAAMAAPRGVALVIGNAKYAREALSNPIADANDMAAALRDAGFDVTLKTDLDGDRMRESLADFEDRLRRSPTVGVFYYAGHGMQTSQGRNVLLPVGREWKVERDAELHGVPVAAVLSGMQRAGAQLNIVILDACRNSPMPTESRSVIGRGLARMDAPSGSLIAYAASPGQIALENPGQRNGLYTQHLLRRMREPGRRLEDVFKLVGRDVETASSGYQSPEESMKLRDATPFCFFQGTACGVTTRIQSAEEIEQEFWTGIVNSTDAQDFSGYLRRYPNGRYAALAERRLRQLTPAETVATAAPRTAPAVTTLPAPATVTPSPAAAAMRADTGRLGVLTLRDRMTGKEDRIPVDPVDRGDQVRAYSTGDVVGRDGRVLAVRVGPYVGTVVSGELWRLPIAAGASGKARLRFSEAGGLGDFSWQVTRAEGDLRVVKAYVQLPGSYYGTEMQRRGNWTVQYRGESLLPAESYLDTGISGAAGNRQPEMVEARLTNP